MIKVPTFDILTHLPSRSEQGELAFVEKEQKIYFFNGENWEPQQGKGELRLSLYELNKDIYTQLEEMNHNDIVSKSRECLHPLLNTQNKNYYMLLNNERHYYTLYVANAASEEKLIEEFVGCIRELGKVKSIDLTTQKDAVEVWITNDFNETFCLLFFNYTNGVIECL